MNPIDIDHELRQQGLLPAGPAGPLVDRFLADAATPQTERFRGALLGGAIGDALGRPIEGRSPRGIRRDHGRVTDYLNTEHIRPGTYSVDTQLTMWTAEAILDSDDPAAPARFAELLLERIGEIRAAGEATREAIRRLDGGRPWWRSGVPSAGNGVAMRVAALGLAHGDDPQTLRAGIARNAVVTHADELAIASGIVQAYAVARLTRTPAGTFDPAAFLAELVDVLHGYDRAGGFGHKGGRVRLVDRLAQLGGLLDADPEEAFGFTRNGPYVLESLPAALWAFLSRPDDPEAVIVTAVHGGYDANTVAAMAGTLAGAYHGETSLPDRWLRRLESAGEIKGLADRLHDRFVAGIPADQPRRSVPSADAADRVHVAVLLDRSGSMASIVDDAIGGFNAFLADQRTLPGEARISLVQFDSQNPQEIVADATPVDDLPDLTADVYQPRGMTPLLDALGTLIERIDRRVVADPDESQLVAVMTDGHENASSDFSRSRIARMVKGRSDAGWAFVFLGANIDSYAEAGRVGMAASQTADWQPTRDGVREGFAMVSDASLAYRRSRGSDRHQLKDRLVDEVRPDRPKRKRH